MDIAELGYKVDSRQMASATTALDKNTAAAARTDKATDKLEKSWKRLGKTVGIGIAIIGGIAVAGLTKYIRNTIEAEKVQAQLASRIKDTGSAAGRSIEQLNKSADALQRLTTFDDEKIGEVQAMLLTFKNIRGDIFDAATASVLDLATAMGTDANSAALQLGKALNDPIKGIAALGRAGIQFSSDQKKVIEGLITTGKVAEAQRLILKEVEGQMGTAAEAARNTLGGALAALENSFDNLLEGDSGSSGVTGTREGIEDLIDTLNDPEVKSGVDNVANGLLSIANAAIKVIAKLGEAGSALGEFFSSNDKKSMASLENRRVDLEKQQEALGRFRKKMTPLPGGVIAGALMTAQDEKRISEQIKEIDALISARNKAAAKPDMFGLLVPEHPEKPSTQPFNVSTPETADKTDKAEAAARKLAKAMRDMSEAQREWQTELGGTGNPIMDDYAQRLDTIRSKAEDFAASGVPTEKIAAFTAEMSRLAEQIKDKAIVDYLAEFDLGTRTLAASMAGDGSSSLVAYEGAVRELNKEMQSGILTQELYDQRLQVLAMQRDSAAENVLRNLDKEIEALGKSAEWVAKRNALIDAGVTAESEYGKAILDTVTELYAQGEAMADQVETMDAIRDAGKGFIVDIGNGAKPIDAISDALDRLYQKMLAMAAEKLMDQIFGKQGEAAGGSSGGWLSAIFGAFSGSAGSGGAESSGGWMDLLSSFGSGGAYGGGRANGGDVRGNRFYQTGERNRPELLNMGGKQFLIPGDHGRVDPMGSTQSASGGTSVVQNIYTRGQVTSGTARQLQIEAARKQRASTVRLGT